MNSQILLSVLCYVIYTVLTQLKYKVQSLYLNADDLNKINKNYTFFSVNSFNLFSFYERDLVIEIKICKHLWLIHFQNTKFNMII